MDTIEIVAKVKKELEKQHMTYKELSEKSEVPLDTLNNFFRGKTKNPRIDTIQAIEHALGLDKITPEERAAGATETIKKSITPKEDELLYLFRCLSDPLQDSLLNVARTLSGQPDESNLHKKA